jgi:hypothetical protein
MFPSGALSPICVFYRPGHAKKKGAPAAQESGRRAYKSIALSS